VMRIWTRLFICYTTRKQ